MISCLDLRPGNWIMVDGYTKPVQVTVHSFRKIKEHPKKNHYIEITPDILRRAKFELKVKGKVSYWQRGVVILHSTFDVYLFNEKQEQISIHVRYVHALQNLWCLLTGEELELSLNPDLEPSELYGLVQKTELKDGT